MNSQEFMNAISNFPSGEGTKIVVVDQMGTNIEITDLRYQEGTNSIHLHMGEPDTQLNGEDFSSGYQTPEVAMASSGSKGGSVSGAVMEKPGLNVKLPGQSNQQQPSGEAQYVKDDQGTLHSPEGKGQMTAQEMGHLGGQRTAQLVEEGQQSEAEQGETVPYQPEVSGEIANPTGKLTGSKK